MPPPMNDDNFTASQWEGFADFFGQSNYSMPDFNVSDVDWFDSNVGQIYDKNEKGGRVMQRSLSTVFGQYASTSGSEATPPRDLETLGSSKMDTDQEQNGETPRKRPKGRPKLDGTGTQSAIDVSSL